MNVHQLNRLAGCNFLLLFAMFVTATTTRWPSEPLGMESGAILDEQITASSEYNDKRGAPKSRLNFYLEGWTAKTADVNQWLQVDLGDQLTKITRVATQGTVYGWVKKYKLQYSNDSRNLQFYREQGKSTDKEFPGNVDHDTIVYQQLNPPIRARYIRFRPTAWNKHRISMRVELYGCKATGSSSIATLSTTTTASLLTSTRSSTITTTSLLTSTTPTTTVRTVTLTSSVTEAPSTKLPSKNAKLLRYVSLIKALDVNNKGSLQNATNATCNLVKDLKKDQPKDNDINILVATQELETFAVNYGKIHFIANESKVIFHDCLAMKIQKVSANNKNAITFTVNETSYSTGEDSASISLPSNIFKGQEAVVVSILYNGIAHWVPDEEHVELAGKTITDLELRSRIISSTVYPGPTGILQENVTIAFSYSEEIIEGDIPYCVFWDFTIKSEINGSWSGAGCTLVKNVNKEITCSCNHLTNFAVLMQVGSNEIPSDHKLALDVITYVGCALSLVGEVLTIIAYCALIDLKEVQIQIRFNLVVAIAIAQITFLAGIDASGTKGVCVFVAALIHYFYLAGFAWMLFEGVYLYLMLVKVFNTEVRMRLFYAVAWGLPLLIVMLSVVIASFQDGGVHNYVHGDFCWVSFTNNLIWTFVTPVLVVFLINSVIFGRVVHEILTMQTDRTSELERVRQGVKACVVLFPLLGMTWVFGVLSVTDAGLAFQYIFTVLNSLQGFFIFTLHVLRNGDVREAYSRKKQQWKHVNSIGATNAANHNSIGMRSKVVHDTEDSKNKSSNTSLRSLVAHGSTLAMQQDTYMSPVNT